ncbi:MAG: HPr family phosphocarrier protein [Desulfobacterales bacterium]|nr:HPr family phosphocarrier protein [Desulfobacterales bacterium]
MDNTLREISRDLKIINDLGLHARAAAMIAKLAQNAKAKVWIIKDGEKVDASSVIDILTLACVKDSKVQLRIDDRLDLDVLNDIVELVESGFGE